MGASVPGATRGVGAASGRTARSIDTVTHSTPLMSIETADSPIGSEKVQGTAGRSGAPGTHPGRPPETLTENPSGVSARTSSCTSDSMGTVTLKEPAARQRTSNALMGWCSLLVAYSTFAKVYI